MHKYLVYTHRHRHRHKHKHMFLHHKTDETRPDQTRRDSQWWTRADKEYSKRETLLLRLELASVAAAETTPPASTANATSGGPSGLLLCIYIRCRTGGVWAVDSLHTCSL